MTELKDLNKICVDNILDDDPIVEILADINNSWISSSEDEIHGAVQVVVDVR